MLLGLMHGMGSLVPNGRPKAGTRSPVLHQAASFHATVPGRHPARVRDSSKDGAHMLHSPGRRKVRHILAVTMSSGVRGSAVSALPDEVVTGMP